MASERDFLLKDGPLQLGGKRRQPAPEADDQLSVIKSWQANPSRENTGAMLRSIRPDMEKAVRANVGNVDPYTMAKAKVLSLDSLQKYDPSKSSVATYLNRQLMGLKRLKAQSGQILSVPERVSLEATEINDAEKDFESNYNRPPSDEELADIIGKSPKRIRYVRQFHQGVAEGQMVNRETGESFSPEVEDEDSAEKVWVEFVYQDLDPIDKLIMQHSIGLHGRPILGTNQLAHKLSISPGAVSQRKLKIQRLLDQSELNPFGG